MNSSIFKKIMPHGIALVAFIALSFLFFSPYVFDGKVLKQGDNDKAGGMSSEAHRYLAKGDKVILWTNGAFSGMPTAQIGMQVYGNLLRPIFYGALLGQGVTAPHSSVFLAMLCMYILLLTLRIDWRMAMIGGVGFGLSSFNMDIIEAGHSTKMIALALSPLVLAGSVLAFRKKYVLGGVVFGMALGLQIYGSHLQIVYYTLIILLVAGVVELVAAIRHKTMGDFAKSALAQVVGLVLGVAANATSLWVTQEYVTETIRGKSELASTSRPKEGGLDKEYATGWSYGVGESLTLLVQNVYGGGASQTHEETETFQRLKGQVMDGLMKQGVSPDQAMKQANQQISSLFYTGNQPFVGVSIYWGAIFIFLFMMGLYLVEDRKKWWLSIAALVMLMTAWGGNFFFFDFMFDYFPYFNKFRSVSQALGLGQLLLVVLSMLSLQAIFDPSVSKAKKQTGLMIGAGVTALLCLMAIGVDVVGKGDAKYPDLAAMLQEDRGAMIRSDVFRSLFLIFGAAALIWLSINNRLKALYAVIGIGLLTLGDVWSIGKRIIYAEKFETAQEATADLQPTAADKKILLDPDPHYRVLDLSGGAPFTNARTSNFHKSVGGYHAAKLMRYQEFVEKYLGNFEQNAPILQQKIMPLYGMLNVKYIMMGEDEASIQQNPMALGNAWFVKNIQQADNADKELDMTGTINPRYDVVIQKSNLALLNNFTPQYDSTATIKLTSYHPDKLQYESNAKTDQLAVFSEIYYPTEKGMSITIDGQPSVFVKANYILRAAKIPAGNHKIVMAFAPKSYFMGETISYVASGALILLFIGGLILYFKNAKLPDVDLLPEEEIIEKKQPKEATKPVERKKK